MTEGPFRHLFSELRRRKVFRVALGYGVVGWLVVEIAATVLPLLGLPEWTATFVIVLVALGFPIALVLAWAFEATPGGVKRETPSPVASTRTAGLVGLGVLAVAGGLGMGWWWLARAEPEPAAVQAGAGGTSIAAAPSIAVLPFVNMSGEDENEYFSDGITEEILNALANVEGLRVAARTSSFAFKGRTGDVTEVGRELRVGTVLEGSVRRAEDRVRIAAQLIDVESGYHLWSEVYDRELADVFAVQDEIAGAIAETLEVRLMGRPVSAAAPEDPRAYDLYLQGRHLTRDWDWLDSERARTAIALLDSAIALDPGYARAWAAKADAYVARAEHVPAAEVLPAAKAAALRALELDSTLVETRLALGDVLLRWDWDWEAAEEQFRRAVELDPTSVEARRALAGFLFYARRVEEARRERRLALELARSEAVDPDAFRLEELREMARLAPTHEEAAERYRRVLELSPGSSLDRWQLALRLIRLGRGDEAARHLERVREERGDAYPMLTHLGYAYVLSGRTEEARRILRGLLDHAREHYVGKDQIAYFHFLLEEEAEARRWMERAFDERHWWLPAVNQPGWWFEELRERPWFMELLRRMNAPGA